MSRNIVVAAVDIANRWHEGQTYGDGTPMISHVAEVATLARDLLAVEPLAGHETEVLIAAGWLHDTIEDTDCTADEIASACGRIVAGHVDRISDVKAPTRKERKILTLPRIAENAGTVFVKCCDRIVNHKWSILARSERMCGMYASEYDEFSKAFRRVLPNADIWKILDEQHASMLKILDEMKPIEPLRAAG